MKPEKTDAEVFQEEIVRACRQRVRSDRGKRFRGACGEWFGFAILTGLCVLAIVILVWLIMRVSLACGDLWRQM
ncbi:MAG: hypothetical protein HC841_00460 [Verrucomicrobiae bacterium]|nr:hypothetical protein [Verrucomicrobiae bacterium]